MGSTPTRSRQLCRRGGRALRSAIAAALIVVLGAIAGLGWASPLPADPAEPAPADTTAPADTMAPDTTAPADTLLDRTPRIRGDTTTVRIEADGAAAFLEPPVPWHRQPKWIMTRSAVVPGWGQWANGKPWKALVVALGEGYLIYRAIDYGGLESDARDSARSAAGEELETFYRERADYYGSRRRDFTWWTIFAAALSMGDAYVDAHLRGFDLEFEPQEVPATDRPAIGSGIGGGLSGVLRVRAGLRFTLDGR